MAYNIPPSKSPGDALTAAEWNTYIRDNMVAGVPDQFAAAGDLFVGSGANVGVILPASYDHAVLESNGAGAALSWSLTVPQVAVSRVASQSIPDNTVTAISFSAEVLDTDGFYPGSGDTITIPSASFGGGLYMVTCRGYFDGHATDAKLRQIGVQISGSNIFHTGVQDADGNPTHLCFAQLMSLSALTTIKMVVNQISGGALNFTYADLVVARIR